jgi:hypothetical protein
MKKTLKRAKTSKNQRKKELQFLFCEYSLPWQIKFFAIQTPTPWAS